MDGTVIEQVGSLYNVELDDGRIVTAYLSGKLRMNYIRVTSGDRVTVELDSDDESKGRITYRYRQ